MVNIKPTVQTMATGTHGRYLIVRPIKDQTYPLLVGFHGYGENAEAHLAQLRQIPGSSDWLIVSIQALHRFYNSKTGDVIGSWMTSLDRGEAILDNLQYVTNIITKIKQDYPINDRLVFVGFSQGVAMAYRSATRINHHCDGLIALAGDIPPELKEDDSICWPRILIGYGQEDQWYTQDKRISDIACLNLRKAKFQTMEFQGGHEWTAPFLESAGQLLKEVAQGKKP